MKTSKAIILAITAFSLCLPPALAQRAVSRGGGSSRSVSSPSRSVSSPSRSASSSSHSFSSPSRSVSSSSRSVSTPSRSSSSSRTFTSPSSHTFHNPNSSSVSRSSSSRSVSMPSRSVAAPTRSGGFERGAAVRAMGRNEGFPKATPSRSVSTPSAPGPAGAPAPSVRATTDHRHGSYARPGVLPPSHRPIHPAPYFHHPWHHRMVHCRPIIWDPIPPRPWHWPGFWLFCNSYWYDYHVTDVVVVRQYVQDTYKVDIVTYGISGDIMYAIVRDGGDTFLQVYDKEDHLLAEQKINKKYCNMVIDPDNGGCWISKKNEKDPLLFIWAEGQLLIYEAD